MPLLLGGPRSILLPVMSTLLPPPSAPFSLSLPSDFLVPLSLCISLPAPAHHAPFRSRDGKSSHRTISTSFYLAKRKARPRVCWGSVVPFPLVIPRTRLGETGRGIIYTRCIRMRLAGDYVFEESVTRAGTRIHNVLFQRFRTLNVSTSLPTVVA